MKYLINLPGFEGQTIELQSAGLLTGAKLLVDGQPAPKGQKRGEMLLRRNDGKDVVVRFKGIFLDVPVLLVDDELVQVAEPLKWYEWGWNCLPILIVVGGGAIPFLISFIALSLNLKIFRQQQTTLAKYGLTGLVTVVAFLIFLLLGVGVALLQN